jgi:formiminoglutamase
LNKGPSSGTPFFRLLNEHSNFNFFEVGTQPQCNSKKHFEFVQSKKGQVFLFDAPIDKIKEALSKVKNTDLFISIDIDYFSSSLAPGCSQSWPIGSQNLIEFLSLLAFLFTNFKVRGVGIYETSPPLDVHDATAKLAACLAHQCLGLKMGSL